jgi:hypothetical protein
MTNRGAQKGFWGGGTVETLQHTRSNKRRVGMKKHHVASGVFMRLRSGLLLSIFLLGLAFAFSACSQPGFVTGGGFIPSADKVAGDKANYGFNAKRCDFSQPATGHFNYHDMNATGFGPKGVKMNGTIENVGLCTTQTNGSPSIGCGLCALAFGDPPNPSNQYGISASYDSTNPNLTGSGELFACVVDNGQGKNAPEDQIALFVISGPFTNYLNAGLAEGNIKAHDCP